MKQKPKPPFGRKRRGFTLIELLVTIAIIATLAAILLPSVGNWHKGADKIGCANNLRQMFIYLNGYAQDHNGVYPAAVDATTGSSWWMTLTNFISVPSQVPAVGKKTIFLCPAALKSYPDQKAGRTYAMNCEGLVNEQGVRDWRVPTRSLSQTKLSQTLYIIDSCAGTGSGDGYHYFRWDTFRSYSEARHSGKMNGLFLDGHVDAFSPDDPNLETLIKNLGK